MRGGDLAIRQARDTFAAQGRSHTQGNVADKKQEGRLVWL